MFYLDTSAFLKLIVSEPESQAMREWMASSGPCWSSQLLRSEAMRAARRLGVDITVVHQALEVVSLVTPAPSTFLVGGSLEPPQLRTLDALHLAAALELGDDLDALVTYDTQMIEGARAAGIAVLTPIPPSAAGGF
jgi:predicted nucleic acid-binding protein